MAYPESNEQFNRQQGEELIAALTGEEAPDLGYPATNEQFNREQGERLIEAVKNFSPSGGLPDPSTLSDGTAMVAVDGEWKMQEGYGWTEEGSVTTITWDGDTEGKVVFDDTCFKVSDLTPSKDSMSDAKIVFKGVEYDFNAVDIEGANGYYDSNGLVTVFLDDSETPKGIYFASGGGDEFVSSLTYGAPSISHPIDHTLMPEGGIGWTEKNITTITWDGDTEGKTVVEVVEGFNLVLVSDETPSSIIGGTVERSNGESHNIDSEDVVVSGEWGYASRDVSVIFEDGITVDELEGITFEHKGVYFFYDSELNDYVSALTYSEPDTIHKIDEKYIPSREIVVNITYDEENDEWVSDKTYEELNAFANAGMNIKCLLKENKAVTVCNLMSYVKDEEEE